MSECYPQPKLLGGWVKVESDVSKYETKLDLKMPAGIDTSKFAKKVDLAHLKSN